MQSNSMHARMSLLNGLMRCFFLTIVNVIRSHNGVSNCVLNYQLNSLLKHLNFGMNFGMNYMLKIIIVGM